MNTLNRKKIQKPGHGRPHVVILGAGASLAAFPNGDTNGIKLPLMWNLVDVVGLTSILNDAGITENHDNFEKLYSDLVTSGKYQETVVQIDQAIFEYFAKMQLPNEPTLYDHLVLSLREKDVVATFNWDPFLVQAMARNEKHSNSMPLTLFLHGNTAIGYCMRHAPIRVGLRDASLPDTLFSSDFDMKFYRYPQFFIQKMIQEL